MKKFVLYTMAVILIALVIAMDISAFMARERLSAVWPFYYLTGLGGFVSVMYFKLGRDVR